MIEEITEIIINIINIIIINILITSIQKIKEADIDKFFDNIDKLLDNAVFNINKFFDNAFNILLLVI